MIIVARKHISFGYNDLGLVADTFKFFWTPNLNQKDALAWYTAEEIPNLFHAVHFQLFSDWLYNFPNYSRTSQAIAITFHSVSDKTLIKIW